MAKVDFNKRETYTENFDVSTENYIVTSHIVFYNVFSQNIA